MTRKMRVVTGVPASTRQNDDVLFVRLVPVDGRLGLSFVLCLLPPRHPGRPGPTACAFIEQLFLYGIELTIALAPVEEE